MRYYKTGGDTGDVIDRAEKVTGANLDKLRAAGLDTEKFKGLGNDEIMQLYNLVQKYKSDFQPEEKGDIGAVIGKAKAALPKIKGDMDRVSKMTGVATSDLKDMAKGLVDQSDKMNYLTRKSVNAAISAFLKRGGYVS